MEIFGYSWDEIQRAQQGGSLGRAIDTSKPVSHDVTEADLELLAKHGNIAELESAGFYGSADRLRRAGK